MPGPTTDPPGHASCGKALGDKGGGVGWEEKLWKTSHVWHHSRSFASQILWGFFPESGVGKSKKTCLSTTQRMHL